jgi:predicted hydrocarbon binding protein
MPTEPIPGVFYYPNRMGRILLLALRKELGHDRLHEVLVAAGQARLTTGLLPNNLDKRFTFENVSALQEATEKVFGARAGRQINYRVGKATFELGLKDFDPVLGISDLPKRLTSLSVKLRIGLDVFARVFNQFSDQVVKLSETETHHLWIIERCPVCWKRATDEVCCHLAGGLLEESLFWGTGGHRFKVEEVTCIARGDPTCVFQIDKQPLD